MRKFLKKVLVFSVAGVFASVDCFGSDGGYDHDYDYDYHDVDSPRNSYSGFDYDDMGVPPYYGVVNQERPIVDRYKERIGASKSLQAAELSQWKDEYAENQRLIGVMSQQIKEEAKENKRRKKEEWADYLSSSIETGKLVFFRSPDAFSQKGLFITLVSKEQFKVLGDWTQHAALIVQYANETNGQALFVHLARKEEKDITCLGYNHVQEIDGLQMVLGNLVLPRKDTVPYSPFMTWCVEPTQLEWQCAYATYQELLNNLGKKDFSYSTRGASYGRGLFSGMGGKRYWKGSHNCVTYCSMILEKFGVIAKTDLIGDELSKASFKTQLARRLIMSNSNSGILLSKGKEDFQGEGGARVHPWVTMNVGRVIGELIREDSTEVS